MAAVRMAQQCGVALATAAAVPVLIPTVLAEEGEDSVGTSRMLRPTELPIYEDPEELLDFEYHGRERTALEENIGVVRKEVEAVLESTRAARERVGQIYETGKAHSMATVDYITDEENVMPRAGAITIGGLAGLIIGARRRGSLVKKVLYTSTGVATAASLCYPRQAYQVSQKVYGQVKDYSTIGYNFIAGVKPQSKTTVTSQPAEEVPAVDISQESTPTPEGGEVRISHLLPPDKFPGVIDSVAQQVSDVAQLGFRLTNPDADQEVLPLPKALEGFGTVGDVDSELSTDSGSLGKETSDVGGMSLLESPEVSQGQDGGKNVSESIVSIVLKEEASVLKDECFADHGQRTSSYDVAEEGQVVEAGEMVEELEDKAPNVEDEVTGPCETVKVGEDKVSEVGGKFSRVEEKDEKVQDEVAEIDDKVTEMVEMTVEVEGVAKVPEVGIVTEGIVEETIAEVEELVEEVVGEAVGTVEAKVVEAVEETAAKIGEEIGDFVGEKVAQVAGEKIGEVVKEKVTDIVEREGEKIVGEIAYDVTEKLTMVVEEKVAGEVAEVAGEMSEVVGEVAEVAQGVEEVGEKAESALTVVEEMVEMGAKAAEDTATLPETVTERMEEVEEVVKVVEQAADIVTTAAGQVESLAEEVEKKMDEIAKEAKDIEGSEEKQEEIFEEIVGYAEDKLKGASEVKNQDTVSTTADVVEDVTSGTESPAETFPQVTPVEGLAQVTGAAFKSGSTPEKQLQTDAAEVQSVKHMAEEEPKVVLESAETMIETSVKREGLIKKLVQFFSKDEKSVPVLHETPNEPVKDSVSQSSIESVSLPTSGIVTEMDKQSEKVEKVCSNSDKLEETAQLEIDNINEQPDNIVEVLEPAIAEAAEGVVDEASKIVKAATSEVAEFASNVVEVTDVVEAVGEKIISVMDTVQELTSDAIVDEDMCENVAAQAGKVKLVSEGVEVVAEKVVAIAEKVEEVAELVKEGMMSIEQKATELIESEEKRKEFIEDAIDFVTGESVVENASNLLQELEGDNAAAVTHESQEVKEEEQVEEETMLSASESYVKAVTESQDAMLQPAEPVLKKGLFNKLVQVFSKDDEEKEEYQGKGQRSEVLTETVEEKPSLKTDIEDVKELSMVEVGEMNKNVEEISDAAEATTNNEEISEVIHKDNVDKVDVSETSVDTSPKADIPADMPLSLTSDTKEYVTSDPIEKKNLQESKSSQITLHPAEAAVSKIPEREGLLDKLISLFSKDKEERHLGSNVSQESQAAPEPFKILDSDADRLDAEVETQATVTSAESQDAEERSVDKLVSLLPRDEEKAVAYTDTSPDEQTLHQEEEDRQSLDVETISSSESTVVTPEQPCESPESVVVATELTSKTFETADTDTVSEISAGVDNPQSEQEMREGLFDKLVSLFSKNQNAASESQLSTQEAEVQTKSVVDSTVAGASYPSPVDSVDHPSGSALATGKEEVDSVNSLLSTSDKTSESGDIASDTSSSVEPQSESTEPGGLIGTLVRLFTKDEDVTVASREPSPTDTFASKEPVVETSDPDVISTEPTVETLDPAVVPSESTVETSDSVVDLESQHMEKEGLIVKLINIFSKDEKNAAAVTESPETLTSNLEPVASSDVMSDIEKVESVETTPESPLDNVANIFTKDEGKNEIPSVNPQPAADTVITESVTELVDVPLQEKVATESTKETVDAQMKVAAPMEKEGLLGKLAELLSSRGRETQIMDSREKSETQFTETSEDPTTDPEAFEKEQPVEKAIDSEMGVETSPVPEKLKEKRNAAEIFTDISQEDREHSTVEASDTASADPSTPSSSDRQEDSQVELSSVTYLEPILSDSSVSEASGDAEPFLEVKDKGLYGRLAVLISDDEITINDPKLSTREVTAIKRSPVTSDPQPKNQVKSAEESVEATPSEFSNLTKVMSSEETARDLPTQEQRKMANRMIEESSGKAGEDEINVVKMEAGSPPGETIKMESGGHQDTLSPAWRGWLRTGASVKQEGKDVIVQLTPPPSPVEKDYGQSNPEDSDMYTTRG